MASTELPNPFTPLAWLPTDIANELEVSRYLYVGTAGAWTWDWLSSLPQEFQLFYRSGVTISNVVYILSRLSTAAFLATSIAFQAGNVANCHTLVVGIGWMIGFASSFNSLLFWLRIKAVFSSSPFVVWAFFTLWLAAAATALTTPFGIDGVHIGTTQSCVNSNVKSWISAATILLAVHDTSVFIAISIRLLNFNSVADTFMGRVKVFLGGNGMGQISKMVLQTGQLYYLATVGMNILTMIFLANTKFPAIYRAMFGITNLSLQNAMACRVYRSIHLGLIKDPISSFSTGAIPPLTSRPIRFGAGSNFQARMASTTTEISLGNLPTSNVSKGVRVEVNTETVTDGQDWQPKSELKFDV